MDKFKTIKISNQNGMQLEVSTLGATILSLKVPNKQQSLTNVVVGLKNDNDYRGAAYSQAPLYLGATIGRYAGRISKGTFSVAGKEYTVAHKDGVHLHGGVEGFDKKYWNIEEVSEDNMILSYLSSNLEEGYPGNLNVQATFEITPNNALKITYTATTDAATPVNLTTHPYLNLNGGGTILDDSLVINSDSYLAVDTHLIPTGEVKLSKESCFDRQSEAIIGKEDFDGFDDTFVLKDTSFAAKLYAPATGIKLEVQTNQKGMVVYTPKKFPSLPFNGDYENQEYPAICFEPQNYPDAPNQNHFPNSILNPNEKYSNEISFQFSVE